MQTIDLDSDRGKLKIMKVVLNCKHVVKIVVERSSSRRGWHFTLWCDSVCRKCRRNFDDKTRHKADMTNRKPYQRDVLFERKTRYYPAKLHGGIHGFIVKDARKFTGINLMFPEAHRVSRLDERTAGGLLRDRKANRFISLQRPPSSHRIRR